MFRIGRSAVKLVNIKKFNGNISSSTTRALSLSVVQSNNNNGTNSGNYGSISLLASMLVGAVITIATHKVLLMQLILTNYTNKLHYSLLIIVV